MELRREWAWTSGGARWPSFVEDVTLDVLLLAAP